MNFNNMTARTLTYVLLTCLFLLTPSDRQALAQNRYDIGASRIDGTDGSHWNEAGTDSVTKTDVPVGLYVWTIKPRFGDIVAAEPDTLPHLFQNDAFTSGRTGHYNYLGNLGSPRISRVLTDHRVTTFANPFIFEQPYDFFLTQPGELLFTNTKSPITNITYHECGNKQNGEDRIRGIFAVNAGKRIGLGFKLDYLYGRGYYDSQSTAHFNGTLFGSYRGDAYQLHTYYAANHLKTSENGGIESDDYVTRPEIFPTSYGTSDMPTRLTKTWNKLNVNTFYLTQRYSLGFRRYHDEEGRVINVGRSRLNNRLLGGAIKLGTDSLGSAALAAATPTDSTASGPEEVTELDSAALRTAEFVPVAGFVHTLRIDHNNRRFLSNLSQNASNSDYFNDFYLPGDSASDFTSYLHVENTLALELREGFNRWAKSGLRLFARHDFYKYTLPDEQRRAVKYTENYVSLGAQLIKTQGRFFHYDVLGEVRSSGKTWGEFNVTAEAGFSLPLRRDTLRFVLRGDIRREQPGFYLRHYHGRNAWWDNSLNQVTQARVGATISYRRTRLDVSLETLQDYAYLREIQTPRTNSEGTSVPLFGVGVEQTSKNIQLLSATLSHDISLGIFHWDNELTGQLTSDADLYPLPAFSAYTNVYLLFRIAKVLQTELGADARYFTAYNALTYSPIIGQYAVQDGANRVEIGNYPSVNVYANFHLKNTRFYVMASHVNYSSGSGRPFLVPHYPMNRMVLRFGVSWNFFN